MKGLPWEPRCRIVLLASSKEALAFGAWFLGAAGGFRDFRGFRGLGNGRLTV